MAKKSKASRTSAAAKLPTKSDILAFIQNSEQKVSKRDIARHFQIRGDNRRALKAMLAELADEGLLAGNKKELRRRGTLPSVTVLNMLRTDSEGDVIGEPAVWDADEGPKPQVRMVLNPKDKHAISIGVGDRVLARVSEISGEDVETDGTETEHAVTYQATPIRRLPHSERRMLGIFRAHAKGGGMIEPVDRKYLKSWRISNDNQGGAKDGDLVRFELARSTRHKLSEARVVEALGNPDTQQKISLIAIHAHGLPDTFPETVLEELPKLKTVTLKGRDDLRDIPLITIDPADARDHDDAVYAMADDNKKNAGGFVVYVAIADVAHYVRPGTQLDREARLRANSAYFPDRVVPMLPERISNDLCSLRENEDRPCLAVRLVFNANGSKIAHTFQRGLMRSHAKLSYQQAQAAFDGRPAREHSHLADDVLKPLYAAYQAILKARQKRSPLELDLPERKILLNKKGQVDRVVVPERLAAHKLIEEFMIQANVAAAETLERHKTPLIYRVHEAPSKEKIKALREFLESLDLKIPPTSDVTPKSLNAILTKAKDLPSPDLVHEMILRSQAQAEYSTDNRGHFGLHLARYAHFTSPIRRYADLIVHRALVRALALGDDGLGNEHFGELGEIAQSISETERRTMAAERETNDRLIAAHLADRIGATFNARISGVTRAGLFVRLADTGADGFVPISTLEGGYYDFIETAMALVDTKSRLTYRLGDEVEVRLVEAIPTAGALRFEMMSEGKKSKLVRLRSASGARGKGHRRAPKSRRRRR